MKKGTRLILLLLGLVTVFCISTFASTPDEAKTNLFYQAGQIAREKMNELSSSSARSADDMYAIGDDFSISKNYFDLTVSELVNSGHFQNEAQELAEDILFEKYSLYYAAVNAGCVVNDQLVYQVIDDTKAGIQKASNKDDFYNYLKGMGMTEEAYWESQFDNVKIYESIAAYQNYCYQNFAIHQASISENVDLDALAWESEWNNIVSQAIANQNIQIIQK